MKNEILYLVREIARTLIRGFLATVPMENRDTASKVMADFELYMYDQTKPAKEQE